MAITSVAITIYTGDMFENCMTDGIDLDATRDRYEDMIAARLEEEYPQDGILSYSIEHGVGYDRIYVETDGSGDWREKDNEELNIGEMLSAIWERGEFWVEVA
jgi:hypothetical protein